jgi:hypothetical protein
VGKIAKKTSEIHKKGNLKNPKNFDIIYIESEGESNLPTK